MRRARRGTSLLEISVTLAIVGVLASLAMVNMDDMRLKQGERDALRGISMQAIQARTQARSSQYPVRLAVRAAANGSGQVLRWEQLGCQNPNDRWGDTCPSAACRNHACGEQGCECVAMGEPLPVPQTLDVSAVDGLCWLARSAQPRQRAGGTDCIRDGSPPQGPLRILERGGQVQHLLQVDGLTGTMRMVNCRGSDPDPECQ